MLSKDTFSAKILIIEEQALALNYMKRSLEQLNFKNVKYADEAKIAKELCTAHKFDLILCSFNLSKKQDGYHLYEELKAKKIVKYRTGFIFISSETSGELVHSVIELQPDDFLAKPFSIKELNIRIQRVLKRKYVLKKIHQLIDDENDSKAIKQIDIQLKNSEPMYNAELLKLKGEALLRLKRAKPAKRFYKSILDKHSYTWAKVGLVQALIANNEDEIAYKMLKTLLKSANSRLSALEHLGHLKIKLNQLESAQSYLDQAANLAPRNINRQKSLGKIAAINHDYERSFHAHKEIIYYAKHSVHDKPEIYLNAARSGIDYALSSDQIDQISRATRQTQQYLSELKVQFPDANHQSQLDVLNARIHYLKNETPKAKQIIDKIDDKETTLNVDAAIDKAKVFHELGYHDKASRLFEQIVSQCQTNPAASDALTLQYIQQQQTERNEIKMGPKELNNFAVSQFKKGNLSSALDAFTNAFKIMPKNASIALNLIQCLLDNTGKNGQTFNSNQAKKCFDTLHKIELEPEQQTRLDSLSAQLNEMGLSAQ